MTQQLFSRPRLAVILAMAAGGLALGAAGVFFTNDLVPITIGPTAFSKSADGHRAFVQLLERLEVPTLVSTFDTAQRVAGDNVLAIIEPEVRDSQGAPWRRLQASLADAGAALIVLPKWHTESDPAHPGWVKDVQLLPTKDIERLLELLQIPIEIVRPEQPPAPGAWRGDKAAFRPVLPRPQLVRGDFDSLLECDDGVLIGETEAWGTRVVLVADPDLVENHGLGHGDNAALMLDLIDDLRSAESVLVFDETARRLGNRPSLWRELVDFPLVLGLIQAVLAVVALIWAATGRFGKPDAGDSHPVRGKAALIENIANLLRLGGHSAPTLKRYFDTTVRDVARTLHLPGEADTTSTVERLARAGVARRAAADITALALEVEAAGRSRQSARLLALARRIHAWRKEMIGGAARDSHDR
jgi:hypothetical protein